MRSAQVDTYSGAAHAVERRETAGQDFDQILPVGRRLPIFAHRDERYICLELFLQIDADVLLLIQISGVEPSAA